MLVKGLKNAENNAIVCLMVGRSIWGDRHTNATFWKDSNGKTFGIPHRRVTKRHHRAGYKNLVRSGGIVLFTLGVMIGLAIKPLIMICLLAVMGTVAAWWYGRKTVRLWQAHVENKTVITPMAKAMATIPQIGDGDMVASVTMVKGWMNVKKGELGRVGFPNTFHADEGERERVNKLIQARIPRDVEVKWHMQVPIYAKMMVSPPLPTVIPAQDKLADMKKCKKGEYVFGYDRAGKAYIMTHNGDMPMKGFSMGSSTGKSVTLRIIAAQLLHNDQRTRAMVIDTKQVSAACLKGIPGVYVYDDPDNMGAMWNAWKWLFEEMRARYVEKKAGKTDFEDFYLLLDEGNDFSVQIKNYYQQAIRPDLDKPSPANPTIWPQYIAPLLWQGREVRIFVLAWEQNFMDRFFGSMSLRSAFSTIGMAGFKPGAVRAIMQAPPDTPYQDGQGRVCVFEGRRETWVQVPYGDETWIRAYASEGRDQETWKRSPE
jgi:hypothetical protein